MRRLKTYLMQPLPPCMPNVRRWRGLGGCGQRVCHPSGGAAGPIGHQTAGQHPSWAVPTPPPLSPPPPMSAAATLCQSSPTVSPLGAPLARNCTRPPSRLWRGTLYGTSPVKTPGVPPQSWGWMNSLSSHGSGEPFRWRTAPRQSVRTSWMHRNGRPAALGAPQVARLAGRQRWHPPHLPLSLSRVGIWRHQSQLSVQLTDEQDRRI